MICTSQECFQQTEAWRIILGAPEEMNATVWLK